MGFFSTLREVNEATHGKRLERQFRETIELMDTFDAATYRLVINKFLALLFSLQKKTPELYLSEGVKLGRDMAASAQRLSKTNKYDACALWLAAAWMESLNRSSDEATRAYDAIEKFALAARKRNFEDGERPELWEYPFQGQRGMPQYDLGEACYKKNMNNALVGFYKNVPYVVAGDKYETYIYVAVIYISGSKNELFVARGQKHDKTQFDDCFYGDGQQIFSKRKIKPFFQGEDGFISLVKDTINIILNGYT